MRRPKARKSRRFASNRPSDRDLRTTSVRRLVMLGAAFMVFTGIWGWFEFSVPHRPSHVRLSTADEILCPVGGMPIDRSVSVETPDGTVFFCCEDCIERYQSDPSAFLEASMAQHRAIAASVPDGSAVHVSATTRRKE